MKLAALFSGGKDSTYSIFRARQEGHSVECLVTIAPRSEESMLLHFPCMEATKLQSTSMRIPQVYSESGSDAVEFEADLLAKALARAKEDYCIDGIVHGGIRSEFQRERFGRACELLGLEMLSPVWRQDQGPYMRRLLEDGFRFIITGVSAGGLDYTWLAREVTLENVVALERLSEKFGFNLNFEGGEAETLVIDCPLFSQTVSILRSRKIWDGYRGRLEIDGMELVGIPRGETL